MSKDASCNGSSSPRRYKADPRIFTVATPSRAGAAHAPPSHSAERRVAAQGAAPIPATSTGQNEDDIEAMSRRQRYEALARMCTEMSQALAEGRAAQTESRLLTDHAKPHSPARRRLSWPLSRQDIKERVKCIEQQALVMDHRQLTHEMQA
eukprot:TRINITY_DN14648_c0_g1_i2.p1 TRINITY_DN14648_c0_g1~~TRINITY_DN14648_c0_g1_i2.p1  ORF type:complete len:151 (+),score=24.10 TRINITY_DN14648_c0_g1_i2:90-542(+)